MIKYLNQKGSAMVLVLSSLIILTAVGGVVIMLSAANITMSRTYSNWSAEYYKLDYAAEERLSAFDKSALVPAETIARFYLQNSYYQYESVSDDFPNVIGTGAVLRSSISQDLQTLIYTRWTETEALLGTEPVPTAVQQHEYEAAMQQFVKEAYVVLYFSYVNSGIPTGTVSSVASNDSNIAVELTADTGWFPNISAYATLNAFYLEIESKSPQVEIRATDTVARKMVNVFLTIVTPSYSAVEQIKYFAVKANPLYTNALSVQGGITFTGSGGITIVGDVVSNNKNHSDGLTEGNTAGIKTELYSAVDVLIHGNVSSAGDLHLWGSDSSITVNPYPTAFADTLNLKKNILYSSEYFFDYAKIAGAGADEYTEGNTPDADTIAYIYKDSGGGNVYCNNLAIEENVHNGSLSVSGNVWTQDDVQNDGSTGTSISIAKNYIGMHSDANESNKDPNGSSAVINNAYLYGGAIEIDGSYIIPGTAWYKFAGVNTPGSGTIYYQTAESATARAGEYFDIYAAKPGEISSIYFVDSEEYYSLYEHASGSGADEVLSDRITRFKTAMQSLSGLKSDITISTTAPNYTLGVVNADGIIVYDKYSSESDVYIKNQNAYSGVSGSTGLLSRVFTSKTQDYGTSGFSFSDLIEGSYGRSDDGNGFHYYNSDKDLVLSGNSSGIIYASGDLTLSGNGTFYGSIICAGDLTVHSGVSIVYDEAVIRDVLGLKADYTVDSELGSRVARRFFSPGKYAEGVSLGTEEISSVSTNAVERDDGVKRYTINSWKESSIG